MLDALLSPRLLRRLEGAAIAAAAAGLFYLFEGRLAWFAAGFLAPDLSLLGYLRSPRIGALLYNAAHNLVVPILLGAIIAAGRSEWLPAICIWITHIGVDRLCGFELKRAGPSAGSGRETA